MTAQNAQTSRPTPAASGASLSRKCEIEEKDGAGTRTYKLTLEYKGGALSKVQYAGSKITGKVGGDFFCNFEVTATDSEAQFSQSGGLTTVQWAEFDRESFIKVNDDKSGFSAIFENLDPSSYCGGGAQIPRAMTLTDGKCKAQF